MRNHASLSLAALIVVLSACSGTAGTSENTAIDAAAPGTVPPSSTPPSTPGDVADAAPPNRPPVTTPDAGDAAPSPPPGPAPDGGAPLPSIPAPTGTCPAIAAGDVTFAPAGIAPRKVTLSMTDAAKTKHGPLVFYWHGTGSSPSEAQYAFGATLAAIEAAGGIVAAPYHDPNAGQFPWYLVGGTKTDDLLVADEVLACVAKSVGIDPAHVHSLGFSAGALQTTAMSYLRSSYLASVVTFSGGVPDGYVPMPQDPANLLAALIFDGGANDNAFGFDFQAASQRYKSALVAAGHFAAICDHGRGHAIPTDAAPSVWAFFEANGFGVSPSPYAKGLPAGFPAYCSL